MPAGPLLLVISAPSGVGKTTLCQNLLAADPRIRRAVTCTTRAPRPGEQDGVDYHFLTPEEFERRAVRGDFLEHATVYGGRYGTLRAEVTDRLRGGGDVLLTVDVQGAASVRSAAAADPGLGRALVTVFVAPPSLSELESRLRGRATETEASLQRRLEAARAEMARGPEFDYLLLSATRADDLRRMQAIVEVERMRSFRAVGPVLE